VFPLTPEEGNRSCFRNILDDGQRQERQYVGDFQFQCPIENTNPQLTPAGFIGTLKVLEIN
jgi:hypothetical protein